MLGLHGWATAVAHFDTGAIFVVHLIMLAGRQSTMQNFDTTHAKFRGRPAQSHNSELTSNSADSAIISLTPKNGLRSTHHFSGSCPTRQLFPRRRKGVPVAVCRERPDSPTRAGIRRSPARSFGQN